MVNIFLTQHSVFLLQQLEEETRLMQHAMQRYKTEMVAMETTLFSMSQLASTELTDEER